MTEKVVEEAENLEDEVEKEAVKAVEIVAEPVQRTLNKLGLGNKND